MLKILRTKIDGHFHCAHVPDGGYAAVIDDRYSPGAAPRASATLAPPFGSWFEPDARESSETIVVDTSHLCAPDAQAPDAEEVPLEIEIEVEPLPAAQVVGGYVLSAEYMRRIVVYARRERRARLGREHP